MFTGSERQSSERNQFDELPGGEPLIVAAAPAMLEVLSMARRAAVGESKVLITGESGVGKDLIARTVHVRSPRANGPFVAVNCAGLTETLLESELFGHVKGSFTGAYRDKPGKLQMAHRGTLFLDEVGEMSLRMQALLLRFLETGEIQSVGAHGAMSVANVRVIAATNRNLSERVAAGEFREDLLYRLRVIHLHVPPLRERREDVPLLIEFLLKRGGRGVRMSDEALQVLQRYRWPGNVRELQNVIAWIAVQSPRRGRIGPSALPRHVAQASAPAIGTFEAARVEFERRFIRAALASAHGQRTRSAAALGVTRQGLAKMIRRLGIDG
jgi:two-component system response regulator AtoC